MQRLVQNLLKVIEQPFSTHHFEGGYLKQWPGDVRQALLNIPLLHRGGMLGQLRCDRCEHACLADVEWETTPHGQAQPYLRCMQPYGWGRIPLEPIDVELWHTSFTHLATAVASFLGLRAPREEVIPERLWWIGGQVIEHRDVHIFLARGADWEDASKVFPWNGRMRECPTPLVLVPCEVPVPSPFPQNALVRSLVSLLELRGTQVALRIEQLAESVRRLGTIRQQTLLTIPTPPGMAWPQVIIEFVNDEYVQICVGKETHVRSFAELGFADLRKPVPTPSELWVHFCTLAKLGGHISWETKRGVAEKDRTKVRKWISDIRLKLKAVFPDITGDPFEPYKQAKAYTARCILRHRIGS